MPLGESHRRLCRLDQGRSLLAPLILGQMLGGGGVPFITHSRSADAQPVDQLRGRYRIRPERAAVPSCYRGSSRRRCRMASLKPPPPPPCVELGR